MENAREEIKELQIGSKVRKLRQQKRMTLQALADATGLSKPLLSQIENEQVIAGNPVADCQGVQGRPAHLLRRRGNQQVHFRPGR